MPVAESSATRPPAVRTYTALASGRKARTTTPLSPSGCAPRKACGSAARRVASCSAAVTPVSYPIGARENQSLADDASLCDACPSVSSVTPRARRQSRSFVSAGGARPARWQGRPRAARRRGRRREPLQRGNGPRGGHDAIPVAPSLPRGEPATDAGSPLDTRRPPAGRRAASQVACRPRSRRRAAVRGRVAGVGRSTVTRPIDGARDRRGRKWLVLDAPPSRQRVGYRQQRTVPGAVRRR